MARRLLVRLGLDRTDFERGLQESKNSIGQLGQMLSNALSFAGADLLVDGLKTGFKSVVKDGLDINNTLQQSNIAFTNLMKSSQKATQMVGDLWELSKDTPLEFPSLLTASKRMLAFHFASQDVIPDLTSIGDAASGLSLGAEGVNRITLALGQMKAKGKSSGDELLQLTEAGVPAWDYLAKAIGKTVSETQKLAEKGLIPADQAIKVIIAGMQKDFGGMMSEQSKSYDGLMSTLKDSTTEAFGVVMKPEFDWLTNTALPEAIKKVSQFTDGFKTNGLQGGIKAIFSPEDAEAINSFLSTIESDFEVFKNDIVSVGEPAYNVAKIILSNWSEIGPVVYGVVTAMASMSVVNTIAPMVSSATAAVKSIIFAFQAWQGGAATLGESLAFIMGPTGWIAMGVALIVGATTAIYSYNSAQSEMTKRTIEAGNAAAENQIKNQELINKYVTLKDEASQSAEKTAELTSITYQLTAAIPGATSVLNDQTMAIERQKSALDALNQAQRDKIEAGYYSAVSIIDQKKKALLEAQKAESNARTNLDQEQETLKSVTQYQGSNSKWTQWQKDVVDIKSKTVSDMENKRIAAEEELKSTQSMIDAWEKLNKQTSEPWGYKGAPESSYGYSSKADPNYRPPDLTPPKKVIDDGSAAANALKAAMASMAGTSKDALKKTDQALKEFLSDLKSTRDEFASFGNMFEKNVIEKFSPAKLQSRLKQTLKQMQEWQTGLSQLASKGVDEDTLYNLRSLGVGGSGIISGLNKMTSQQLKQSLNQIGQIRGIASDQAYTNVTYKHKFELSGNATFYGVNNEGQLIGATKLAAAEIASEQSRYENNSSPWRIMK